MQRTCPVCGSGMTRPKSCGCGYSATPGPSPLSTVLMILAAVALNGAIGYYIWQQMIPGINTSRDHSGGGLHEVSIPPPLFEVRQGTRPTLNAEELKEVRRLFREGRFDLLNLTIEQAQTAFEQDHAREYEVTDLIDIFASTRADLLPQLDAWAAASPERFAPYLARAKYHYAMGWNSRGYKFASETSEEQLLKMRNHFQAAETDLERALRFNPHLLAAHLMRIRMHSARSDEDETDSAFEQALLLFPDSYLLYRTYLQTMLPRWGGSYREMEEIAVRALGREGANPEMYFLPGAIYQDQAWYLRHEERFEEALALCAKALEYGEHSSFYKERGSVYLAMKDLQSALADADQGISLRPARAEPYLFRASVRANMEDWEGAGRDISMASLLAPDAPEIQNWLTWAANRLVRAGHGVFQDDLEEAVTRYGLALKFDPRNAEAFYWRAVAYNRLGRPDLALADCRRAIDSDPWQFEAYRLFDSILAADRRWEEVIDYWDRYLALEPDKAEAYLERAGAHRRQGNMNLAIADLSQACELGNQEACRIRKRFR